MEAQRDYKDRMFRLIFKEKKDLLSLYNAVNGTHHTNADDLEITTLKNAVYMNMKNDISFVFDFYLSLYEHQSSVNPNMPLRDLMYVSRVLQNLTKDANLYSSSLIKIPTPRFVVFYNGEEELPEKQILRLSDAYEKPLASPELELTVTVYNINLGHNEELMNACQLLKEYAQYVDLVRKYQAEMSLPEAVERTVDECIQKGILADFLRNQRAEAIAVSIFEYDQEKHMQSERKEHFRKGLEAGKVQGLESGIKAFILDNLEESVPQERIIEKLQKRFELSEQQAMNYIETYANEENSN